MSRRMPNNKLNQALKSPAFKTPEGRLLWSRMGAIQDVFNAESWSAGLEFADAQMNTSSHPPGAIGRYTWHVTLPESNHRNIYVPIRGFREAEAYSLRTGPVATTFLSSGTTADVRSSSHFSADGLQLYRLCAIKTFAAVLQGFFAEGFLDIHGISLVPLPSTSEQWQKSSLAHMLEWFGSVWSVSYVEDGDDSDALAAKTIRESLKSAQTAQSTAPVWLFGTAFHYINLYDSGARFELPPGSVVIETGGTKGRSRNVGREQLYKMITELTGVSEERIISEYGMCELASQSYDWWVSDPDDPDSKPSGRSGFRFPAWVKPYVMNDPSSATSSGLGLLLLHDRARLDIPWLIQTEDLAKIRSSGGVELHGRVPTAPLKGCSLLAEPEAKTIVVSRSVAGEGSKVCFAEMNLVESVRRGLEITKILDHFLGNPHNINVLASEIRSKAAATQALSETQSALPRTDETWRHALLQAGEGARLIRKRWVFILPSNHSIAGVYPLAFAAALGLEVVIRIPAPFAHSGSFLQRYIHALREGMEQAGLSCSLVIKGSDLILRPLQAAQNTDAILAFGETTTISQIMQSDPEIPVKGFGSSLTAALLTEDDIRLRARSLAQDAFALGQRGCMSARFAILLSRRPTIEIAKVLGPSILQGFRAFWETTLDAPANSALCLEEVALRQRGAAIADRPQGYPLVVFIDPSESLRRATAQVSRKAFVLPIFIVNTDQSTTKINRKIWELLNCFKELNLLTYHESLARFAEIGLILEFAKKAIETRTLGNANNPPWNGLHQGQSLFGFGELL